MAITKTEVIHHDKLEIRRGGSRFGTLWIDRQNIQWRASSD